MPSMGQTEDKLRQQHAQLLAFNHILVEENNHRLLDHADLMTEVGIFAYLLLHAAPSCCSKCMHLIAWHSFPCLGKRTSAASAVLPPKVGGINCRQMPTCFYLI